MIGYRILMLAGMVGLWGCVPSYTLVEAGATPVANKSLIVQPSSNWNRIPASGQDMPWEESWTKSGPLLDTIAFVGGVPDGKALVKQKKKDDHQVPVFRANMSPDDLVSMVEASYRIGGVTVFDTLAVEPVRFLGQAGLQMDFRYVSPDQLARNGRCVMGVVDKQLYILKLEGAEAHYYAAVLPEFAEIVASTTIR